MTYRKLDFTASTPHTPDGEGGLAEVSRVWAGGLTLPAAARYTRDSAE